jgi:Universal stress protein family
MTGRRVIAPVTFAHDSLEAAAVAAELAAALGAELVLAGIAPVAPLESSNGTITEVDAMQRQAEHQRLVDQILSERLEELAEAMPDGLRCRTMLTWGPVGPMLVEAAQRAGGGSRRRPDPARERARPSPARPRRPLRPAPQRRPGDRRADQRAHGLRQMIRDAVATGCDGSWITSSSSWLS